MDVAVVVECVDESRIPIQPWNHYRDALAERGIHLHCFRGAGEAFERPYDAMLLHVFLDWNNEQHFDSTRILPILAGQAIYRARFPEVVQIVVNHSDIVNPPSATPYWRPGDPILYRTPLYDRSGLWPFPADEIFAFENIWGHRAFTADVPIKHPAGFVGTPTGPRGYRRSVARETAKVGIGICEAPAAVKWTDYASRMAECAIVVCPRGWGAQSMRHWDAWRSGKPVMTDLDCHAVEMVPGVKLEAGVHYLVYDEPEAIPDLVSDWTQPSRRDDLAAVADAGKRAALSYDGCSRIIEFFETQVRPRMKKSAPKF